MSFPVVECCDIYAPARNPPLVVVVCGVCTRNAWQSTVGVKDNPQNGMVASGGKLYGHLTESMSDGNVEEFWATAAPTSSGPGQRRQALSQGNADQLWVRATPTSPGPGQRRPALGQCNVEGGCKLLQNASAILWKSSLVDNILSFPMVECCDIYTPARIPP